MPLLCCCTIVPRSVALSSRCSPTRFCSSQSTTSLSSFTFNLGLIPLASVEPIFEDFRIFSSHSFFRTPRTFYYLQSMPRRPPPTPLHLVQGPLPPRGRSKFTMPSIPRPIFHPQKMVGQRPVPRERVHSNRERETGWRVEGRPKLPSPCCTVGRAHVRFGELIMPPKAAGTA